MKKARARRTKTAPEAVWLEYEKGRDFNDDIDLYDRVKNNENFFIGKQWEGVDAPNIEKPVFNLMKRVINYFVAMLVADNISVSLSLFNRKEDAVTRVSLDVVKRQIENIIEYNKFHKHSRSVLRNAAVDGDACIHVRFDPEVDTGRKNEEGFIIVEEIDSLDVFFGNPQIHAVQDQPYIIIAQRRLVSDVKDMMEDNGHGGEADRLKADEPYDQDYLNEQREDGKATLLTKYWKENGEIWYLQCTRDVTVKEPTATGLKLYPLCWMSWDRVKNCYHGRSCVDGLIPNQVTINKLAAMSAEFLKQQAYPRVIFNKLKLKKWIGGIKPIGVDGDPNDVIFQDRHNTVFSGQVGEYISRFMGDTKELMGASDAALGNITNPDNTSAIIATQKATAVPLELTKQEYYQFVEDFVRISIDNMRAYFGKRKVLGKDEEGNTQEVDFDFSALEEWVLILNVDIGQAAYWSELTDTQTLSNLLEAGLVDPITYLESIPSNQLPFKERIVSEAKAKQAAAEEQEAAPEPTAGMPPAAEMPMM